MTGSFHHGSTWQGTSWIMLTDVVGTSVLTFAGVARQLGWVLTISFIIGLAPVAVYTALLMSRTSNILAKAGARPATMGEAARMTLGGDRAAGMVYFAVYGFAFLGNASYILILGQCMQGVFFQSQLCLPTATAVACALCVPISVSVRHLSESVVLCFINLFLILAVLAVVMGKMYFVGRPSHVNTFAFAEDLSFWGVFGAASNVVYSYAGHWLYFELMVDMQKPEDFPRVFLINVPLQVCLYLLVACWGYHFAGDKAEGYFLDNLPDSDAFRIASALLFLHVLIAFLVKNVVLVRAVHKIVAPSRVDVSLRESGGQRAQAEFATCAVLLLCAYWAVANAIPFFSDFLALVGSLLSGPISFVLPAVFLMGALQREAGSSSAAGTFELSQRMEGQPDAAMSRMSSFSSQCRDAGRRLTRFDFVACAIITGFILLSMAACLVWDVAALQTMQPCSVFERVLSICKQQPQLT
ncbi:unnamed protein product [Cladocopium goreaui]|uniref:Amino acid transporter transmembrane domain-containing protein n=1 Tax=Cladocopium goreaui TaxID=2562237 RepID=A0A9P1GAI4_9DINO|nr:unnamed protein product [Cladocopium goreaui]